MIDYIRTYKQFVSSHHFYEGLRMTIGVMTPVILMTYYGHLPWGIALALGALCVSITDNPGPVHHRRNGMLFAIGLISVTSFITGVSVPFPWLVMVLLGTLPFVFSMLGVFGVRAGNVGMACMLVMMLNIDKRLTVWQVFMNAMLIGIGGSWYFLLSMMLHQLRPYKLVQQVLGDCIRETASYLHIKASFYQPGAVIDKSYEAITESQVLVHNKQEAVRELLYKTRSIVKESTHTGRVLLISFLDTVDLFERIMTSQQEYQVLHTHFEKGKVLSGIRHCLLLMAEDLDAVGIAFQEGKSIHISSETGEQIKVLEQLIKEERAIAFHDEGNALAFIGLGQVLLNLKDIKNRIDRLYQYSSYDLNLPLPARSERDYRRFVARSQFSPGLILDNLNPQSNIFRHAIRVCLALLAGYALSIWLPLGHDYWILLTIIVILKPAYALTRQRNFQRLAGTIGGAALGGLFLFLVKDTTVLIGILLISMLIAYSLLRTNYFVSVFFMTVFILIAFYFLKVGDTKEILQDRIVDTAIGSAISFILIFVLPPRWEHESIRSLCANAIEANKRYYRYIAGEFLGETIITQQYKLRRKETYVALANLSDAFQRMLNEPKSKQVNGEYYHQLIVSNHVMASQVATLSAYRLEYANAYRLASYAGIVDRTEKQLELSENWLHAATLINQEKQLAEPEEKHINFLEKANVEATTIAETNQLKLPVFTTINILFSNLYRVATDIKTVCKKL